MQDIKYCLRLLQIVFKLQYIPHRSIFIEQWLSSYELIIQIISCPSSAFHIRRSAHPVPSNINHSVFAVSVIKDGICFPDSEDKTDMTGGKCQALLRNFWTKNLLTWKIFFKWNYRSIWIIWTMREKNKLNINKWIWLYYSQLPRFLQAPNLISSLFPQVEQALPLLCLFTLRSPLLQYYQICSAIS